MEGFQRHLISDQSESKNELDIWYARFVIEEQLSFWSYPICPYSCPLAFFLIFAADEEIGAKEGMELFVEHEEFKKLNTGFALDEGVEEFCIETIPYTFSIFIIKAYGLLQGPMQK